MFATVAFAGVGATGTGVVETGFLLDGQVYSPFVQSDFVAPDGNGFRVVPLTTGLALDRPQTVQVGCVASQTTFVSSQPTTITAIQVESVTRIQDQSPGIP